MKKQKTPFFNTHVLYKNKKQKQTYRYIEFLRSENPKPFLLQFVDCEQVNVNFFSGYPQKIQVIY